MSPWLSYILRHNHSLSMDENGWVFLDYSPEIMEISNTHQKWNGNLASGSCKAGASNACDGIRLTSFKLRYAERCLSFRFWQTFWRSCRHRNIEIWKS